MASQKIAQNRKQQNHGQAAALPEKPRPRQAQPEIRKKMINRKRQDSLRQMHHNDMGFKHKASRVKRILNANAKPIGNKGENIFLKKMFFDVGGKMCKGCRLFWALKFYWAGCGACVGCVTLRYAASEAI